MEIGSILSQARREKVRIRVKTRTGYLERIDRIQIEDKYAYEPYWKGPAGGQYSLTRSPLQMTYDKYIQ
jgi:hypothetical protein